MGIKNVPARVPLLRKTPNASLALATGTATSVVWQTTIENYGFILPNTTEFRVAERGLYRVNVLGAFGQAGTTPTRRLLAIRNVSTLTNMEPQSSTPSIPTGVDTNVQLTGVFDFSPGISYDVRARQDSGVAGTFQANSQLAIEYVGPVLV